jgi:hypothetical protein
MKPTLHVALEQRATAPLIETYEFDVGPASYLVLRGTERIRHAQQKYCCTH